ncbi:Uncharacterized protein Rs2_42854 [Raphanus sativus]|nr:Uncharacterized protein Rs2_42854 [Raphanus sativus]
MDCSALHLFSPKTHLKPGRSPKHIQKQLKPKRYNGLQRGKVNGPQSKTTTDTLKSEKSGEAQTRHVEGSAPFPLHASSLHQLSHHHRNSTRNASDATPPEPQPRDLVRRSLETNQPPNKSITVLHRSVFTAECSSNLETSSAFEPLETLDT